MSKVKIPFSQPVKTYTAVELARMPLIEMRAAIDAQEKHFFIEAKMGGDDIYWPPRIVRQLEKRDFLKMVKLTKDGEV